MLVKLGRCDTKKVNVPGERAPAVQFPAFGIHLVDISRNTVGIWLLFINRCAALGHALMMMALLVLWCGPFQSRMPSSSCEGLEVWYVGGEGGFAYRL